MDVVALEGHELRAFTLKSERSEPRRATAILRGSRQLPLAPQDDAVTRT